MVPLASMTNMLSDDKRKQVLALGQLGWTLRRIERQPAAPLTLRQVDPLIRDLTHYRDVIARKTQEEIPT